MTTFTTDSTVRIHPFRAALHRLRGWFAAQGAEWRSHQALRFLDARRLRDAGLDLGDVPADPAASLSRDIADELYRLSLGHRQTR